MWYKCRLFIYVIFNYAHIHSSTLAWKIPWMEEPGRLQSMGLQRVRHDWATFTLTFHFHALEREMATHSSDLAWRIPGMVEPGGLPSMGSHRVGHDWSDLAAAAAATVHTMEYYSATKRKEEYDGKSRITANYKKLSASPLESYRLETHLWEWIGKNIFNVNSLEYPKGHQQYCVLQWVLFHKICVIHIKSQFKNYILKSKNNREDESV